MRTINLLLLVASIALAESWSGPKGGLKPEVLARSKRRWVLSTIEVVEEDEGPYPLNISQMFNTMSGNHEFHISGNGVDLHPKGYIEINKISGVVFLKKRIDRETHNGPFHIKFDIYDKQTKKKLDKELSFDVEIKDINDNKPLFVEPMKEIDVKENAPEDVLQIPLMVEDKDLENTPNSNFTVSLIKQTPEEPKLSVKHLGGTNHHQLTLHGCFDYDKVKRYEVIVQAVDRGVPPLSSTAVRIINIVDTNTHPPKFKAREYHGQVNESEVIHDFLRVAVEDKDTPGTPGWRAKYFFIKGNDDENYKIETDPITNEGILSVIKGKDFEKTMNTTLVIGVQNEETLWLCKSTLPTADSINVTVKVIDVNDPPKFLKNPADVYLREEEPPGKVLYTPAVKDEDSEVKHIRFKLLKDPADWVTIDEKTGKITSKKAMDREAPILNGSSVYTVLIGAIDNGEPPATGTGTVLIHLGDINDNLPHLVNKGVIMCGNKVNKVMVAAHDADIPPFSGPFSFSLGDDKTVAQLWKLDPASGKEGGLVSRKTLPYGNYTVPLVIRDQQNVIGKDSLQVMVCDCGDKAVCRGKEPISVNFGGPGIGLLFAGLLLFLLLLLIFMCQCGKKFTHMPIIQEEGSQTLIKYNQEGGGSECKAEPTRLLTPTSPTVTDGIKQHPLQMAPVMTQDMDTYNSSMFTTINTNMTSLGMRQQARDTFRSQRGQSMYSTWNTNNQTNAYQGNSSRFKRSVSMLSHQHVADHIDRRLYIINRNNVAYPEYQPHQYGYEGQGSKCQSLDQLSFGDPADELKFLNDLGPKFKTLGGICHQTIKEKNIQI
ncbi:cadherin-like protein 26 isoform X1 [Acanthopagrus latus]|uniref:cadherin-like protein 26 isoform X1 n=1 Tax=Acanthopagrus latus TaxID=8177 RepID=UPI00187BC5C2|nr:cadherin-like protein 26 isoform X1 [Acanthopagrus latus]